MQTEKKMTGFPSIDKPWLKYYPQNVQSFEIPSCKIYDYMVSCSLPYKNQVAIEYMRKTITYNCMYQKIENAAKALKAYGIKEQDVVSICLPNIPEVVYYFYAINKIGAVANMLDPRSNGSDLEKALQEAKSMLLISLDSAIEKFDKIISNTAVKDVIVVSPLSSLPYFVQKLVQVVDHSLKVKIPKKPFYHKHNKFLASGKSYKGNTSGKYQEDLPAVIAYTGGTTGVPKGVITTNKSFNAMVVQNAIMDYNVAPGDRSLDIAPPWTYYGLSNSLNAYFAMGLRVILIPKLGPDELGELIYKTKPNHIITVPSALRGVINCEKLCNEDLSYIKTVIVGADKLPISLEEDFNKFLRDHMCHTVVTKGYGMTEVTAAAAYTKDGTNKPGSVGIPYIANTISIFNTENGIISECKIGGSGEIAITGPMLMLGYFGAAKKETNTVLKKHSDGKIWAHTGDIGHMDFDGCLYVDGRIKRMIVKNGYKVFPSAIENCILKHHAIESCAAIQIPSSVNGSEIKVYLIKKENCPKNDCEIWSELITAMEKELYSYEIPSQYEFCESLPLTGMNKIDYIALEQQAANMQ